MVKGEDFEIQSCKCAGLDSLLRLDVGELGVGGRSPQVRFLLKKDD